MTDASAARHAPSPFAAALREPHTAGVHAEFDAGGHLDTGSIDFGKGVTLRAAQGATRLIVPTLPDTLASALTGRHVSAVVEHPWLSDPALLIERVDDEDGRLSLVLASTSVGLSAK